MSNYNNSLRPWVIYRFDVSLEKWTEVERFKSRASAETYKFLLSRSRNNIQYDIAFEQLTPQTVEVK